MMPTDYFATTEVQYRTDRIRRGVAGARERRRAARRRRYGTDAREL